jgi:LAO/AO transport system kinase
MLACEAAGFDVIIVETVGVGQSETAVGDMVDMFLLLLLPGGGDELQGIKRGIIELADLVIVNKADGELEKAAARAAAEFGGALRLLRPASPTWSPPVLLCSSLTGKGIPEVWEVVDRYRAALDHNGQFARRRAEQARAWMWSELSETLLSALKSDPGVAGRLIKLEAQVMEGTVSPAAAARRLLDTFLNRSRSGRK